MQTPGFGSPVPIVPIFLAICVVAAAPGLAQTQDQNGMAELAEADFALGIGKFDRAIELLTSIISKKPDQEALYLARALAYSKKGDYDKSIQDLRKVTQMKNPDAMFEAYNMLGRIYEIKKDYASAQKAYQEAFKRAKDPATKKILEQWIADMGTKLQKRK